MQCSLFQIYHTRAVRSRIVFTNVQTLLDASVGWRLVSFPASQIHPRGNSIPLRVCKCRKRTENIEPQINDTLLTTQLSTWPMVMCSKPTDCPIVWQCKQNSDQYCASICHHWRRTRRQRDRLHCNKPTKCDYSAL